MECIMKLYAFLDTQGQLNLMCGPRKSVEVGAEIPFGVVW